MYKILSDHGVVKNLPEFDFDETFSKLNNLIEVINIKESDYVITHNDLSF